LYIWQGEALLQVTIMNGPILNDPPSASAGLSASPPASIPAADTIAVIVIAGRKKLKRI
jgi:hypothetical protein